MIGIDEKLYVTREINQVLISYANKIVLRELLLSYSFRAGRSFEQLTILINEVYAFCPERPNRLTESRLKDFCRVFLGSLLKEDLTALYFWTINHNYNKYLEREESLSDYELEVDAENRLFEEKFGRELAQKLYAPKQTGLEDDLLILLVDYLFSFTDQLDLSLIDEDTVPTILELIEDCNFPRKLF